MEGSDGDMGRMRGRWRWREQCRAGREQWRYGIGVREMEGEMGRWRECEGGGGRNGEMERV